MLKALNSFFYTLTKENWGFPWHIIISNFGFKLLVLMIPAQWAFGIVFFAGVLYELWQLSKAKKAEGLWELKRQKRDSAQDMIANLIGLFTGVFL